MLNLIRNPGLELGDNGDWEFTSECTVPGGNIIVDPANARTGNYRMMVRAGKSGPGSQTCGNYDQEVTVAPGQQHRLRAYCKVPVAPASPVSCELKLKGIQSGHSYLDVVINSLIPAYVLITDFLFAPMPADTLVQIVIQSNPPLGNPGFFNFYFDDFSLEQLTFPNQGIRGFVGG